MSNWNDFVDPAGNRFDLRHLRPTLVTFRLPPTIMRPSTDVVVRVTYGEHCFTRMPKPGEAFAAGDVYSEREGRLFCPTRWAMSADLPRIVASILDRNCFETDRQNHVLFSRAQTTDGQEYAVFFVVRAAPAGRDWNATLMVLSAHSRAGFRPGGKPVKFRNVLRAAL